jgi:two-component system, OmpR family, response regulator
MSQHIAIVEDEPAIRENYADAFRRAGYRVSAFAHRREALAAFDARLPDLVLIDVSLGDEPEGGFDLCRDLRARAPTLPLMFLTARDSDFDAVSGLRLGADDYLTKDISLPHLLARIAALFRRIQALAEPAAAGRVLERGKLRLDADRIEARWDGRDPELTLTEFWIVYALARHPGHVRNRQQLMDAARVVLDDATITSHVKRIRRKFEALDADFDAIQTIYGLGYRWREGTAA